MVVQIVDFWQTVALQSLEHIVLRSFHLGELGEQDRAQSPLTYSPPRIPRIPKIWQRDTEGPAQSPTTYSQPSYHTPQQPHITRIGDTAFSHCAGYPLHTTTVQYTTPGKHKPDTDSPPPYSSFQDEAAGVLGLKRGQQTKNQCRAKRK